MKAVQVMPVLATLLFATACGSDSPTKQTPPPPVVATVAVTAGATSLNVGETTQLTASASTSAGLPVSGTTFTWLSESPSVASVDGTGKVTAVSPGTAVIAANAGTVRGTVSLTVKTPAPTTASVRFVNQTTGLSGSGGFTVNGQFVAGSALATGQGSQSCTTLTPGTTFFAFGAANAGGSALAGSPLVALNNENLSAGGDYTIVAAGPAASPTLTLLVNNFSSPLGAGSAAVRFISFATPPAGSTVNYVFYQGDIGATSPLALNMPFGIQSAYSIVSSGTLKFSAMRTPGNVFMDTGTMITLQPSSANTIALVPNGTGNPVLTRLPRCS